MSKNSINEKKELDAAKSVIADSSSDEKNIAGNTTVQTSAIPSDSQTLVRLKYLMSNKPRFFVITAVVFVVFFALLATYIYFTYNSNDSYQAKISQIIEPSPANDSPKKREWAKDQATNLANSNLANSSSAEELNKYYYDLFDMYLVSDDMQNAVLKYETEVIPKKVQLSIKHLEWLLPYISKRADILNNTYNTLINNYQQALKDADPADQEYINQKIDFYTKAQDSIK